LQPLRVNSRTILVALIGEGEEEEFNQKKRGHSEIKHAAWRIKALRLSEKAHVFSKKRSEPLLRKGERRDEYKHSNVGRENGRCPPQVDEILCSIRKKEKCRAR